MGGGNFYGTFFRDSSWLVLLNLNGFILGEKIIASLFRAIFEKSLNENYSKFIQLAKKLTNWQKNQETAAKLLPLLEQL